MLQSLKLHLQVAVRIGLQQHERGIIRPEPAVVPRTENGAQAPAVQHLIAPLCNFVPAYDHADAIARAKGPRCL